MAVMEMPVKGEQVQPHLTPDDFMKSLTKIDKSGQNSTPIDKSGQVADDARRITGSADIPLNAEGKKESKSLAESLSEKFDWVLTSPEKRAVQTAKEFGKPILLEGLNAWRRGKFEGQPVKKVEPAMRFLMMNPDKRPPGVSPISKEPGESLNEFVRPLLSTVQAILAVMKDGDRGLICTHGGNLEAIDSWVKLGMPGDLRVDHKAMAKVPYWSVPGKLFKIGAKGLEEVKDNKDSTLYLIEHAATDFNNTPPPGKGGDPKPSAKTEAAPAKQNGKDTDR